MKRESDFAHQALFYVAKHQAFTAFDACIKEDAVLQFDV